jgi:molecular chaperone GrpE
MSEVTENKETLEEQNSNNDTKNESAEQVEALNEEVIENPTQEVDEKELKIAELEAKIAEQEALYLRLRADYDNLARRTRLDREAAEKYRAQSLLTDLLPVIDNLDRALLAEANNDEPSPLYKGVDMVYRQLIDATTREGLEVIEAIGQPFDPNVHQAVMQESDSEQQPGVVLKELQKGYKLKDRVLRPSMVSVNE